MRGKLDEGKRILKEEGVTSFLYNASLFLYSAIPFPEKFSPAIDASKVSIVWYLKPVYNLIFRLKYGAGTDVMKEDWDTLILLDACRYDDFENTCDIPGNLDHRISKGADSPSFIQQNFVGKELDDTIYVTANPHVNMVSEDNFYKIDATPIEKWDSTMECVMPVEVTMSAVQAHNNYQNKRIIVHYMQPHDPPIGPTGRELLSENDLSGMRSDVDERYITALKEGEISKDDAKEAYRETLDIVLQEVSTLVNNIDGKVIISSDHGEMFGEKPYPLLPELYEHYDNPRTVELCKVPWLEVDADSERREIHSGGSGGTVDIDRNTVESQLEALGYK